MFSWRSVQFGRDCFAGICDAAKSDGIQEVDYGVDQTVPERLWNRVREYGEDGKENGSLYAEL